VFFRTICEFYDTTSFVELQLFAVQDKYLRT
jgi:hypothetical protein